MAFTFEEFPNADYYRSDLRKILEYMRTFENTLDSYADVIAELQEALEGIEGMDARITALETATSDLATIRAHLVTLDDNVEDINTEIENLKLLVSSLNNAISGIRAYVDSRDNQLISDYNNKFYTMNVRMWTMFNALKERIEALTLIINALDTNAYNPWARVIRKESLQTNLNYAYADLADNIPTAEEYSELGLTATEYGGYDLSAYEYSVRSKKWLHLDFVFSPVYGFKQSIGNVLTSIVNYIQDTMTASEYTALDMTADAYTELDMSATDYYSYLADSGYLRLNGNGLTSEQYSRIGV